MVLCNGLFGGCWMRASQCVICTRSLQDGVRSDCVYCGVRCRVRAHRLRQTERSRSEPVRADAALHTNRIEELEEQLRCAEESRRKDAALHEQRTEDLMRQLRDAEERAAKQSEASRRLEERCSALELQNRASEESHVQIHQRLAESLRVLRSRDEFAQNALVLLREKKRALLVTTQHASALQQRVRELEAALLNEQSKSDVPQANRRDRITDAELAGLQNELEKRSQVLQRSEKERIELKQEVETLRTKGATHESDLAQMKMQQALLTSERDMLFTLCERLKSQVDGLTETVSRYRQGVIATSVVGGLGIVSNVLAAVAAQHGAKITPLNVAEILNPQKVDKPQPTARATAETIATPSESKTPVGASGVAATEGSEPDQTERWKQIAGEQLLRGWRPESDLLVAIIRDQIAAESVLALAQAGKSPWGAKAALPVERDHQAMIRALKARHDCAKQNGGNDSGVWLRQHNLLGPQLEARLRGEHDARTERLKAQTRQLLSRSKTRTP